MVKDVAALELFNPEPTARPATFRRGEAFAFGRDERHGNIQCRDRQRTDNSTPTVAGLAEGSGLNNSYDRLRLAA